MILTRLNWVVVTLAAVVIASGLLVLKVNAADDSDLTISITPGTLATDIIDNTGVSVVSPTAALSSENFSFACLTGANASLGSLGTNTQRLYAINPDAADNGWTLSIAATSGPTTVWENGGATQTFDYNDPTSSGCTDGGDADSRGGQITVDPSVGTLTTDCVSCANTSITLGSSSAFSQGVTDSITLVNAASGSNDVYRGYLTGVGLSQVLPAEQAVDSYDINMTLTIVAL